MRLLAACLLTVSAEGLFLALTLRRDIAFLALCAAVNVATNLALNLSLAYLAGAYTLTYLIYPIEALVVLIEYAAYAAAIGRSQRLFTLTLAANAISYTLGVMLIGHV